jgi:hypothetical protein
LHLLENQLDFWVTSNVNTGTMESNHKCNAKKPSGQTQRRADTFELQTSRRYIGNLILDKAASTLEETYPLNIMEKLEPPLVGAKFSIQLTNGRDDDLLPDATIIWDKSKLAIILGSWGGFAAISWLYLDRMPPSMDVQNTREKLQLEIKFIFRAHPSWRSGRTWHDWALFSWTDTDGTPVRIPGQIIISIWFAEEDISKIQHLSYVSGDTPCLYAMIETLERPLTVERPYDRVVVGGRKQPTTNEFHERRQNGMSLTAPNLCLVPVDTIYKPIAAIPDEGGSPGNFLCIGPVENWDVDSRN